MRGYTAFCYFIGLVAANSLPIQPREDTSNFKGITGEICCNRGTTDPNNLCHDAKLNAYCLMGYIQCSAIPNDKKDEPGDAGGCDQIAAFPVGRNVTLVDPKPENPIAASWVAAK
ncbi:hypothetical protein OOU_Y34scaffold00123g1 [Pyricularia oryzae Y34]|uniref:Uncharacterized protein n=2 Tax=Pyricularia oryzae TaxID=318829 RepID=A0AA97PRE8_PYRO3|nr:hypothetical protein OOU_Y34scaffold00123g1 [Pyricularia oryzae Y34]